MNHSYEYSRLGLELDYQGIILLMWGATVPLVYYGFNYNSKLRKLYWFLLSALLRPAQLRLSNLAFVMCLFNMPHSLVVWRYRQHFLFSITSSSKASKFRLGVWASYGIRESGSLVASISLEPAIRFSMSWSSLQDQRIRLVFCRHSTFYISMGILVYDGAHDLSYISRVDLVFYTLHLTNRTRFIGD